MNQKLSTTPALFPRVTSMFARALIPVSLAILGNMGGAHADTNVRTSAFEYNPQGLLTKETIEPTRPNDCLETSYSYDLFGNRTGSSAAACVGATGNTVASAGVARTSSNNFGAAGLFPISSTNALSQSETKVFDVALGTMTSLTGPNGLTTGWTYDSFGRKTLETRSDGTSTAWTYQLCTDAGASCPGAIGGASSQWVLIEQSYRAGANASTSTTPSAPEKRQFFDSLGRVVRVQTQGFDGASAAPTLVQDTEYNTLGQVARQSSAYAVSGGTPVWTSYTYDALGRVSFESHPDAAASGGIATSSYTYNGMSTTVTNANGQTKTSTKNAQGQVASVTDAQGYTIAYSYDAVGNLLSTNAAGSVTTMGYDLRGRKVAMLDPAMGSWTYSYNAFGELVSQRDSLNQTTTLAYDVLGRMTQRLEPDLNSQWSYDQKFDSTPCGKGVGKLCEAQADSGYNRKHNYDSQGRLSSTATVLDNVGAPATVVQAYDAFTGQIASKTWPTGYQASYSYSALGFLTGVTGGGSNGFTQTASYQVLAMDAAGHVTQFKLGNKVTTVKTFDANTQRLLSQAATTDGQGSGNVFNQSYSYDALGNLLSRADNSPSIGTQENFSYDSLNRLTMATILGGAVSPPTTTQVMYDPRGNITYKSDVGRYWYDTARPNRMTNVTLETAPGATLPVSGTRTLNYTFDDYSAGAQTLGGTTVGNGNLTYTVTHDTTNSRHFVRFESYTSFNMPQSMTYSNFAANTTSCPAGYTLSANMCTLTSNTVNPVTLVYTCPAGQTLSGTTCTFTTQSAATPNYACPSGYTLLGSTCSILSTVGGAPVYGCPSGSWLSFTDGGPMVCSNGTRNYTDLIVVGYSCPSGYTSSGPSCYKNITTAASIASYFCPAGQVLSGSTCTLTSVSSAAASNATPSYVCPSGYTLSGTSCNNSTSLGATPNWGCPAGTTLGMPDGGPAACYAGSHGDIITPLVILSYSCPSGYILSATACSRTLSVAATIDSYSCPVGRNLVGTGCVLPGAVFVGYACAVGQLNGNTCIETRTLQVPPGSSNTADRTLTYIYGPEHQRARENVTLSGNGTSSYFAGNTWFLNGADGLDLTYEKEVRANGTIENRHYLTASGQAFALFTSRTGTLNGLPATTTSYFQHDHLGSIAAISDETGAVTERLAYDPWGKRRNINTTPGNPDSLDTLVGLQTDRGYTEHEHLDEIGVIHMNGRVYDPLIGRFMSADSVIPNPYDLKDFNRYTYVLNNPLSMGDPTGHFYSMSGDGSVSEAAGPANPNNPSESEFGPDKGFNVETARGFVQKAVVAASATDDSGGAFGILGAFRDVHQGLLNFQSYVNQINQPSAISSHNERSNNGVLEAASHLLGSWLEAGSAGFKSDNVFGFASKLLEGIGPGLGFVGQLGKVKGLLAAEKEAVAATELTAAQLKNIERFMGKVPANAKESLTVKALPNEGVAAQAVSLGRVPGSLAVYEKQIDATGKTIQYTKTTYDPAGNIVHVKDKINNGVFP